VVSGAEGDQTALGSEVAAEAESALLVADGGFRRVQEKVNAPRLEDAHQLGPRSKLGSSRRPETEHYRLLRVGLRARLPSRDLDRELCDDLAMSFTRITVRPDQMGGVPCVRGLRIPVATVVGMVADGMNEPEILAAYPDLEGEDIREVIRYAAEAVRERELPLIASG
jgi:uncharacterized protein (DUF433 family)